MAKIINTDGEEKAITDLSHEALQRAIGGCIVPVKLPDGQKMLINENGPQMGLQVNNAATVLCGRRILGNVVLLDKEDRVQMKDR